VDQVVGSPPQPLGRPGSLWREGVLVECSLCTVLVRVGGKGCVGAAVGGRKTTGDQKCQNLQSLAKDFSKLRRRDYLMRMIAIMHPLF
jgi:hypothetical protein